MLQRPPVYYIEFRVRGLCEKEGYLVFYNYY